MIPDWQTACTTISLRGAALLMYEKWQDCVFLVGSEPDQVKVHAHKLILAMASPVFAAMFYGDLAETDGPIRIIDLQPDTFKALLEYIYADKINIASFDKAIELCYAAKKYMLPHLFEECIKHLLNCLDVQNVCKAYEHAKLFEDATLMDECLQMFSKETKKIISDPSFTDAQLSTVVTLFSLDALNIESELNLFEAALKYSKAHNESICSSGSTHQSSCSREETPINGAENLDDENDKSDDASCTSEKTPVDEANIVKEAAANSNDQCRNDEIMMKPIRNALKQIRFLNMTAEEFSKGPAQSALLTEAESHAILINIVLDSIAHNPMPKEFSTSKQRRQKFCEPQVGNKFIYNSYNYGHETLAIIENKLDSSKYSIRFLDGSNTTRPVQIDQFTKTEILYSM